jgi:hypothetical protein
MLPALSISVDAASGQMQKNPIINLPDRSAPPKLFCKATSLKKRKRKKKKKQKIMRENTLSVLTNGLCSGWADTWRRIRCRMKEIWKILLEILWLGFYRLTKDPADNEESRRFHTG